MGIDFKNERGVNLSDGKFDKDAVSLRQLRNILTTSGITREITVFLPSNEIQSGSTIPIDTGIPLPELGKAIEVMSASIIFTANTIPFMSYNIYLITDTAPVAQVDAMPILSGGTNVFTRFKIASTSSTSMVENKKLFVKTDINSIGTGDGVAKVFIAYRIIRV